MSSIKTVCIFAGALFAATGCGDDSEYTPTGTGPAAKTLCTSTGMNAWDTYGVEAFVAVNEAIFTNVFAELDKNMTANLGASFGGVTDLPTFKGRLAAYLVWVYGGPESIEYTDKKMYRGEGQDMTAVHTGMAITAEQYDFFVSSIIVPSLTGSGVPMEDVSSCFAPVVTSAAFKASIVGK